MTGVLSIRENHATILERITHERLGSPISVRLRLNEEWSPRITGDIVIPDTLDLSASHLPGQLWKLQGDTLTMRLETWYGPGLPVKDITEHRTEARCSYFTITPGASCEAMTRLYTHPWHPDELLQPLSAATALYGGTPSTVTATHQPVTPAKLTRDLRQPGGSYLIPDTETLLLALRIRAQTPNELDGTITLQVASEDVRLHDYRLTEVTELLSTHTSLRHLVADVLRRIIDTATDLNRIELAGGPDITIPTGQIWEPGQTAWDFLNPTIEAVGWTLYTDPAGVYHLEPRQTTTTTHTLDADRNLIDYQPTTDLTAAFYDAAVVEYVDADVNIPSARFDVYAPPGFQRVMHETRPGTRPVAGAAEQLVQRSRTRAAIATAQTLTLFELLPGHRVAISSVDRNDQGTVTAITHSLPDAESTVELRDISHL